MEFVYVVKRYDLFDLNFPHGFVSAHGTDGGWDGEKLQTRIREKGFFVERRWAEHDSTLKQIIPYGLVASPAGVFLVKRLAKGGEKRLHDRLSIGIGGHVNPFDMPASGGLAQGRPIDGEGSILDLGAERELAEELHFTGPLKRTVVGFLNDDSNPVGSVHFGVVFRADSPTVDVRVRETDAMEGSFVTREHLLDLNGRNPNPFETWSQFLVEHIEEVLSP